MLMSSVELAPLQTTRRLHTRQSSTFNRRQKKLKIRPDVLVLLVTCADKLNAAQAQLEYRKALKRQATSLKRKG
jgi:Tfp pilus assembly protein PilF